MESFLFHFSGNVAEDTSLPSTERESDLTSEHSVTILPHLAGTEDLKISSSESPNTSLKHEVHAENSEEKFNGSKEITYSSPQTGMYKIQYRSNG